MDSAGTGWDEPPPIVPARRLDGTPTQVLVGRSMGLVGFATDTHKPVHLGIQAALELVAHLTRAIAEVQRGSR